MAVTLTEAAARHVSRYITKRGKGVGVRLGVKTTGCSGLAYKLEYADAFAPEDMVFGREFVGVLELVGQARAAGRFHAQANAHALAALAEVARDMTRRRFGEGDGHVRSRLPRSRRQPSGASPCSRSPPP